MNSLKLVVHNGAGHERVNALIQVVHEVFPVAQQPADVMRGRRGIYRLFRYRIYNLVGRLPVASIPTRQQLALNTNDKPRRKRQLIHMLEAPAHSLAIA